ncbi:MAG TPA: type II toxin-antitoxin system VapC family toxin [Longimicrobium sp.]|nr:type II toxin-antitoxin system VapC family toxin [Longimicrobium sp.]
MRYLIDTNVFSEPVKPRPNPVVLSWAESQPREALAISTLSLGEVRKGLDLLAHGSHRAALEQWFKVTMREQFRGRVLSVSKDIALAWGRLAAADQKRGRVLPIVDGLLLATAEVHDLTLVTRNERDFVDRGVPVFNPWPDSDD